MNDKIEYREYPQGNREHKSTLFCKAFEEKKHLLELYNSVNDSDYQNPEDLEVNTLEDVVYISMKNDKSFLIDCNMNLYEHQSTYNPNMPLRGLLYFAKLYRRYVKENHLNLFSKTLQKIPTPKYVVFYNGTQEQPDEQILMLSEAFQKSKESECEDGCLECYARMLNINYGHNRELMQKCRRLEEYALFVSKVREHATNTPKNLSEAIERAVDECIEEGILADILSSQKAEVLELALTTFDRELYEQGLREEGELIGVARGEGKKLLESVANLQKNLHLSLEDALYAIGTTMGDYEKAKELFK
jgi:hypothetical protein